MSDKPIKHIELSRDEFHKLKAQLLKEYGNKINISWVLKRECGFTFRTHTKWIDNTTITVYCLDFYEEQIKTWFCLKYL